MGTRRNWRARRRHSLARARSLFRPLLPSACYAGYGVVIGTKLWESGPLRGRSRVSFLADGEENEKLLVVRLLKLHVFLWLPADYFGSSRNPPLGAPDEPLETLDYEQSIFFLSPSSKTPETREWPRATEGPRRERHEKRVSLFSSRAAALVSQRSRARALPLLNLKKKRDCSQSIETSTREATFFTAKKIQVWFCDTVALSFPWRQSS